jgi:hypothetical protein
MLKKLTIISILTLSIASIAQSQESESFNKGKNFRECMNNCRYYHQEELGLPHGARRGSCWEICRKKHLAKPKLQKVPMRQQ